MIKDIHMSTAFISISFFMLRALWVFKGSQMMKQKWVKILPHINDSILLITAVLLVISVKQYPFVDAWLTAKFFALIVYIGLGMFALKHAKEMKHKVMFFVLSLLTFSYMVGVALTKSAGWFY